MYIKFQNIFIVKYFLAATDEKENINAVMQHIGMETCIRFKDMSEEEDADQNQEYEDEELGPVYPENSITKKDVGSTSSTLEPPPDDPDSGEAPNNDNNSLPEPPPTENGNYQALNNDNNNLVLRQLRINSTIPTQSLKNKTAGTKQSKKETSNNVTRALKKSTLESKSKKKLRLKLNDKQNIKIKDRAIKHTVNKAAAQKPSK